MRVEEDNGRATGMVKGRLLEFLAVFKQLILEEHWLSRFISHLQSWGAEDMGEGGGTKYKWKEKLEISH